jgi:hypothetical protein
MIVTRILANRSIWPVPPHLKRVETGLIAVFLGLIWLNTLSFPSPATPDLDPSWQSTSVFAHRDGLQLGKDLIFTYGPLGWLNSYFYPPGSITAKIIWELAGKALLMVALYGIVKRLNGPDRWLFLASLLLFTPFFPDTLFTVMIPLALITWVFGASSRWWIAAAAMAGVAVIAQIKFTYALLAVAGAIIAVLSLCLQHRPKRAAVLGSVFVSTYLASWVLAGQLLAGLPEYWRQSWEISQGYPWAMSLLPQRPWALATGLAMTCFNIALIGHIGARHAIKVIAWPALIMVGGALFLSWKHGYTRADGHVLAFFLTSLLVGFALPSLLDYRPVRRWYWLGAALCLLGLHDQRILLKAPRVLVERLYNHVGAIVSLPRLAEAFRSPSTASQLARAIGDASVDVYNYEQGCVLLNGLNYRPRPITQSYSAYTPALLRENLNFLRSPRSADRVLLKIQSIDNRHPMLDDSLSLLEIPRRYSYVESINDYALFKKRSGSSPADPFDNAPQLLGQTVHAGEIINLPSDQSHAIWLNLKARPSFLGKLRAALYQPAELHMVVIQTNGSESRHRVITTIAEEGFMVHPFIENTADYLSWIQDGLGKGVEAVRFEARTPSETRYWNSFEVRLFSLNDFPIKSPEAPFLSPHAPFNLRPIRITAKLPVERYTVEQKTVIQVHAPGEMRFDIPKNIHTLRASFGMRPGSYNEGKTDGVTFEVFLVSQGQSEQRLFQRHLNPVSVKTDQGTQTVELAINGTLTARTIILRTLPGPNNDTKWDWSYWTEVRFLP